MNRVPPRTFYPVVCILLFTISSFAKEIYSPVSNISHQKHQPKFLSLVIAAPVDLSIQTDPFSNTASNVFLGSPTFLSVPGISYTITNNAPLLFPIGITKVTWTVLDNTGNSATAIQNIVVADTEKPYIEHMGEISVVNDPGKCGAVVGLFTPYTYDNSGLPVSLTNDAPAYFSVGSTVIIWTATDAFGNSDTSTQLITVIDNEVPVIKVANVNVKNDAGKCGAIVNLGIPETSDNCGIVSVTNNAPVFFPVGTTLVTWTVTDKTGYTSSAVQTVKVVDGEAPVFSSVPADVIVSCNTIPSLANPLIADNCDAAPKLSFSQTSTQLTNRNLAGYYNYIITRTWMAKDMTGNTATAKQVITVTDKTAPSLTVPAAISVSNDLNKCGAVVKYAVATASDNCNSPVAITYSISSGSLFPVGISVVTVTAKDISGNSTIKTFTIKVNDTQKPLITVPSDISLSVASVTSAVTNLNLGTAIGSDNCNVKSVSNNAPTSFAVGTTKVIWTVTDISGNTSSGIQKVTIAAISSGSGASAIKKANVVIGDQLNVGKRQSENELAEEIKIIVAPNPSAGFFTLFLHSKFDTPVTLRITDVTGRLIESRSKLVANSTIQIGNSYTTGSYFAEMLQGEKHTVVQLIKVK